MRNQDISILVQEGGQPLVLPELTALQRELQARGVGCLWTSDVILPGRLPGMAGPEAFSLFRHKLRLTGAAASREADEARARLKALEGSCGPSTLVTVWRPADHWAALLTSVPQGAVPMVVEQLRCLAESVQLKVLSIGGALSLAGVEPVNADAVLEQGGVLGWSRPVAPTFRLLLDLRWPCAPVL